MSSPFQNQNQNQNPRKWRFTWETLAHIPTLRLFLFCPEHNPSIQCKDLKSSLNFQLSLLSVSWTEKEASERNGIPVDFLLRVPIPRVLIDPSPPVDVRALEDHIEVKLVLLLPVDHPLVVADFESVLDFGEEGLGREAGVTDRLMGLSLDSDLKSLSSSGGVHFYCKSCSTSLTKNPLRRIEGATSKFSWIPSRSFVEMPSVDWREVADNWFGACCCSFGGISEKLVSEYVNSYICAEGTCLLDGSTVIICKDDLTGYSFSDCLEKNMINESELDSVDKVDSVDVMGPRTHGTGDMSCSNGSDGIDVFCGTLSSLSLKEEGLNNSSYNESLSILDCAGKLPQGTGYGFMENTDVAHFDINETCSNDVDFLEYKSNLTSVSLEKQYSGSLAHGLLMKDQSHCCIDETNYFSSRFHDGSSYNVSIPSSKNQESTKYAKLQTDQKLLHNGSAGGGFMVRSANHSNDIEWVEFLCSKCSSLLGSYPSAKNGYMPIDGGVRLFKCCISTSVPVGGPADIFRSHTLQRMFVNQLLESAADELSFRTVVNDLKDKFPMLQIVILNPRTWCCSGHCLDAEIRAEPIPKMDLHPVVKVLFSYCSIVTKSETREIEEWATKNQAAEVYMMKCQIKELIESLKSSQERLPPSRTFIQGLSSSSIGCPFIQGLSLSSIER